VKDLSAILAELGVHRRPGRFAVLDGAEGLEPSTIEAMVREDEGLSVVVELEAALAAGREVGFEAAWLTLDVESDLEAVGLTAAVSGALAAEQIACNVIAGLRHDHLLVPIDAAERAQGILLGLRGPSPS
jgi:hypothetical protein